MTSANPLTLKRSWGYILVALAYLLVNLFEIGGDAFLIQLNGNIGNPLALGVTVLAVLLWRRLRSGNQDRRLWFLLALGWALWTVAEFWWGIANLLGNEVPYPSGADAFWVVGYLPIAVALLARLRRLPTNLRPAQAIAIGLCIILCIGWTVHFVLIPTIESNEPAAWLQNTLNLLYPLLDFLLLILVLRILFQYQQGQYGKVWFWIAGGFVLHSLSGLFFVYATTAGLYYPDGQANPLSTLAVDATYNLGYAAMLYGLAIALSVHRTYRSLQHTRILLERVPNVATAGALACFEVARGRTRA